MLSFKGNFLFFYFVLLFNIGKPSDMWALGVILYTMLYGQFPFYDSNPTQLFNKIKAVDYSFPRFDLF